MTRAVIFCGSERCSYVQAQMLETYLRQEVGLRRHSVSVEACGHKTPDELAWMIGLHSAKANKQPLLIAYFGHGYPDGWSYGHEMQGEPLQISYATIAAKLRNHQSPLLFLNDCCYAAKIHEHMLWIESDRVPITVLSSCSAEETAYGEMTRDILAFWRASKPYVPVKRKFFLESLEEQRHGPELDHYFFPKPE